LMQFIFEMTIVFDCLEGVDRSWHSLIEGAFGKMDPSYLNELQHQSEWLPHLSQILAAFSIPKSSVHFVLLGESPYPRKSSANGYAFWDASVGELWSPLGLSKEVNRATSLRNFLKMLLHAEGCLHHSFTPNDIQCVDKAHMVQTLDQLFLQFLQRGFLLLNASLIWSKDKPMRYHAKHWKPFNQHILNELAGESDVFFLLFGRIAQQFDFLPRHRCLIAEHPYVLSFIQNPEVVKFFKPLHLLRV
jgi:uracil-DNA glycosylase